jgi:hypothetical protein
MFDKRVVCIVELLMLFFISNILDKWPLVEQELLTPPEHLNLPAVFSMVRVAQSLVFCIMFCRSLFVLCPCFSFGQMYCLSFNLQLLITTLTSSNLS